jgi:hypothetical protein
MKTKYQRTPDYETFRKKGREEDQKNSWKRPVIKEARRSWNELRFLAADRSGKNSQKTYASNRINGLLLLSSSSSSISVGGPGSSVDIATGYGLECPGIESQWGRDFPHLSRPVLGPTQPPVQWVPGLSQGIIRSGVTLTPHPLLVHMSKNRVGLYLYCP